jgi:alkanesulfonate monooxygenase SsuD/methylene tetrahydromethanopterin reductase-like flavin-dependent oxidoreductase (luciferase family)
MLMPLYDPRRVAEDTAVLDIISGGRLDLGVGLGYREVEYSGYGIDFRTRARRFDEALEVLLRLWHGETLNFQGKHFQLNSVQTTPAPVQQPHPTLWVGAFSRLAAARVAKYGDGYTGPATEELVSLYRQELTALGKDPATARIKGLPSPGPVFVSEDPERMFHLLAPHMIYWANVYTQWMQGTNVTLHTRLLSNEQELKQTDVLKVMTPAEAIIYFNELQTRIPVESMGLWITLPGLPVERIWDSWELFARKVMPFVH